MLLKTVTDIKNYVSVNITEDFDAVKPYIDQAEKQFIIPVIGQAQYDALNTLYNGGTPAGVTLTLIEKLQLAIINYAYYLYTPLAQVQISPNGIQIVSTDTKKTAFKWQIVDLQKAWLKTAHIGIDDVLSFMETNKATFTIWATSSSYTDFKEGFVNTTAEFNKIYNINNSHYLFAALKPLMRKVEDLYLKNSLCEDLYAAMKTQIAGIGLNSDNLLLKPMVQSAVVYLTMWKAFAERAISIDEFGVATYNNNRGEFGDTKEPASMDRLSTLAKQAEDDGMNYLRQLRDYLNAKASVSVYPLYFASSSYIDPATDSENYTNTKGANVGLF